MKEADRKILLEQYKILVTSADNVSQRRQSANTFFLTINASIFALSGYFTIIPEKAWPVLLSLLGFGISYLWLTIIKSYKQLNSAKFKLIHRMEKNLPVPIYADEWELLRKGTGAYKKQTHVEMKVPVIFMMAYLGLLLFMLIQLLFNHSAVSLTLIWR